MNGRHGERIGLLGREELKGAKADVRKTSIVDKTPFAIVSGHARPHSNQSALSFVPDPPPLPYFFPGLSLALARYPFARNFSTIPWCYPLCVSGGWNWMLWHGMIGSIGQQIPWRHLGLRGSGSLGVRQLPGV